MSGLTVSGEVLAVLAAVLLVLAATGLWAYATAHRLDRLHVRTDSAWLALQAALDRRAVVARAVAAAGHGDPARLRAAASAAEAAARTAREQAENALSAGLAGLDVGALSAELAGELADAQVRVLLARRFHTDAVRDTRALRSRRRVRWLRLGGTAAWPEYFEIIEGAPTPEPRRRPATRVLLIDPQDRVLLMRARGDDGTGFWFSTGGGVDPGEDAVTAGVREVAEEVGLVLDRGALVGPLWRRRFALDFEGERIRAEETYYAAAVDPFTPDGAGRTELELRTVTDARWCTADEVADLDRHGDAVYPPGLEQLLGEAVTAVRAAPGSVLAPVRTVA